MPRRETVERLQAITDTAEARAARQMAAAYNQARRELIAEILARWTQPTTLTPGAMVQQLRALGILERIEARLRDLERETGLILRDAVVNSDERALEAVQREIRMLPRELREDVTPFTQLNTEMVERFTPIALSDAGLNTGNMALVLRRELQAGLLQGEGFPDLVRRLMGADAGAFARGRNSAVLAARRMVITSENAAKQAYYLQAQRQLPDIRKQAIAAVGENTTDCCLRVHGQVQPLSDPFRLTGTPRFADQMMHPSFHWNCRTSIAMWHPVFEQGAVTTNNLRASARAELQRRGR